jgi:hypothetical protein
MSGLTSLNANLVTLQSEWTTFLTDLTNVLANNDSDVAVQQAADLVAAQTSAIASEDAIVNPPVVS